MLGLSCYWLRPNLINRKTRNQTMQGAEATATAEILKSAGADTPPRHPAVLSMTHSIIN
jgi:hypothetical protein